MKFFIAVTLLAAIVAAEDASEQPTSVRDKRGVLPYHYPTAVSYSSSYIHHTPSIPYHVPLVKYVAPVKYVHHYPYAKGYGHGLYGGYPYGGLYGGYGNGGYGYSHGYGHGYGYGYGLH